MYDLIKQIISHTWDTQLNAEQQYIYYISGALILILTVWLLDSITRLIINIGRKGAK